MKSKLEKIKFVIDITQGVAVIIGVVLGLWGLHCTIEQTKLQSETLEDSRKVESARFLLEISRDLDNPRYKPIIDAIEGDGEKPHQSAFPILGKLKNKILPRDIDDYLSKYNDVALLYEDGLIDEDMAYSEFSYDIEKAYCNKDVWNHVLKERKDSGDLTSDNADYAAFEYLALKFLNTDRYQCSDLDKQ